MPRRSPRLITELLALTSTWGWNVADLAHEINVDPTTILHYRSGRRALTKATLSKIAIRFGEHRMVRDLIWHHLIAESEEGNDAPDGAAAPKGIPVAVEQALRAYASRFAEESVHAGRGVFVFAETAAPLSAAAQFARALFTGAKIPVCALRADKTPTAAESRFALAAPLLIVERVDFASPRAWGVKVEELMRHALKACIESAARLRCGHRGGSGEAERERRHGSGPEGIACTRRRKTPVARRSTSRSAICARRPPVLFPHPERPAGDACTPAEEIAWRTRELSSLPVGACYWYLKDRPYKAWRIQMSAPLPLPLTAAKLDRAIAAHAGPQLGRTTPASVRDDPPSAFAEAIAARTARRNKAAGIHDDTDRSL